MCGIAGIYRRGGAPIEPERLVAMRDDQRHRGPDAEGLHVVPHAGLAFNRLAIIDLSPGANQPMVLEEDGLAIVFNGEIYNFQEVRAHLESEGQVFRTKSDTEVILRGFRAWGLDVVPRLDGMFAFALFEPAKRTMHLVRDRLGKKPLFYADAEGEVVFASEVRALTRGLLRRPPPSARAIDAYLAYLAVPGEMSIWEGVHKLPPASILTCTLEGATLRRYWRLRHDGPRIENENEALEQLDAHLLEATRKRLISDVPLGAFLSGGVDSSVVVAQMARAAGSVRTFTITLADTGLDESPYARLVASALGTRHEEIRVEPDAAGILPRLVWHYGEPFGDSSAIPSYYVSQAARREVTVVLTGDGGDEGFAGYPWHRAAHLAATYRENFSESFRGAAGRTAAALARSRAVPGRLRAAARFLSVWGRRDPGEAYWIWPGLPPAERTALYTPEFLAALAGHDPAAHAHAAYRATNGLPELERALHLGLTTYLPDDLLVKVDIASMAHSLEARSPLLDHHLLEFAAALPARFKVAGLTTKALLKKLAARLVPREAVYRRKQGFALPIDAWLRGPLRRPLEALIESPQFERRGLFRVEEVRRLNARHQAGEDLAPRLYSILCLELWHRMFVDGDLGRDDRLDRIA